MGLPLSKLFVRNKRRLKVKPQPLTKDKILWTSDLYLLYDEEDASHHFNSPFPVSVVKVESVKSTVELVLKEIKKKKNEMMKYVNTSCGACYISGLLFVEDLIKKAFSGVIKE